MRIFLISLTLVIAVFAASPVLVGPMVEENLRAKLAQADDLPFYKVTVDKYDRGYRSATVVVSLGFEDSFFEALSNSAENGENADSADTLPLEELEKGIKFYFTIQHGPLLSQHGLGLGWTDIQASFDRSSYPEYQELFDKTGQDSLMEWGVRVGLLGSGWFKSDIPDIDTLFDMDGKQLSFVLKGVEENSTFSDFGQTLHMDSGIEKLLFTFEGDAPGRFSLEDIQVGGDFTYADSIWLGLGDVQFAIEDFDFSVGEELDVSMQKIVVEAEMTEGESSETLDIWESIRFASANFNGTAVTDADLTFAYRNISKALVEAYMNFSLTAFDGDPEQVQARMLDELMPVAKSALDYNPRLEFEHIAFKTEDGLFDASASFGLNKDILTTPVDLSNAAALMPALDVGAKLRVSESLLASLMLLQTQSQLADMPEDQRPTDQQLQQMVDTQVSSMAGQFLQQGFINQEDGIYSTSFRLFQGAMSLNNQPFPAGP